MELTRKPSELGLSLSNAKATSSANHPLSAPVPKAAKPFKDNKKQSSRRHPRRTVSNKKTNCIQTISFFDLAREVRDIIYFNVLRPDCAMSYGISEANIYRYKSCYKLHPLHFEAIGLLNAFENIIRISSKGARLFRNAYEHGMPGFFACDKKTSHCRLGPSLSELQVLRLRHLAVEVRYPVFTVNDSYTYREDVVKLGTEIKQIAAVLRRCRSMQTFRLILQTKVVDDDWSDGAETWSPLAPKDHPDVQTLLPLFLDAAQAKCIKTAAEEQKHFSVGQYDKSAHKTDDYTDPLVACYNQQAFDRSIYAAFEQSYDDQIVSRGFEQEGRVRQRATVGNRCLTSESMEDTEWGFLKIARSNVKQYIHKDPDEEWELLQECRKCYQIFDSREDLDAHLELRPKHRMPFVLSGTHDGDLRFRFTHVVPNQVQEYTAVSYTWGNDARSEIIYVDNQPLTISPTLWACLHCLREKWQYIWADAVCINQDNVTERNEQVRIMDQIYSNAAIVSVWLGNIPLPPQVNFEGRIANLEVDYLDWEESMYDIASRPYWSRTWVIQEFLLARVVHIYCSNTRIDGDLFQDMLSNAAGIDLFSVEVADTVTQPDLIQKWPALPFVIGRHADRYPQLRQPLYDLLAGHVNSQSKDPRDKVFALLGLLPTEERSSLERSFPDYALSKEQVYIVTLAHVQHFSGDQPIEPIFRALHINQATEITRLMKIVEIFDYIDADNPAAEAEFMATDWSGSIEEDSRSPIIY
ncbi:hypothetical protein EPUS_08344 [Endocarpon pusillum Z07020]|uniref:Heterokaryon incompatibility domain-containing protein n=1 Tax=Endocarpon pusillum (strain Z07020 / HMAS-L-300199) TaxID=1263415 RepID=U1GG88_ENDPU|nr:uncharacterized protein EPUS_08344 [Endocarpon pusillum Z07020]ERF70786.1 hypothetical protein EPUS_08344 [Endocarpon pusillum Z07020]